jgi:hypothetical protein
VIKVHIGLESCDLLLSTYDALVTSSDLFDILEQLIKELNFLSDDPFVVSHFGLNFALHSQEAFLIDPYYASLSDLGFNFLLNLGKLNTLPILVKELLHVAISQVLE